ncbi:hypothetical protein E4T56_gene13763 [Termitomyces sp. T112]|nr:hypothetical protein E4T56_gene13763 [Termitomyces sp. T112]
MEGKNRSQRPMASLTESLKSHDRTASSLRRIPPSPAPVLALCPLGCHPFSRHCRGRLQVREPFLINLLRFQSIYMAHRPLGCGCRLSANPSPSDLPPLSCLPRLRSSCRRLISLSQ